MSSSKNEKSVSNVEAEVASPPKKGTGEESEEESEVLEESPCGRWQKRREEVQQRNVPGIDCAFLAMDTEEGVEVVWNEVRISEKKSSKVQLTSDMIKDIQDKIRQVFDNLIELEHPNIAKFHKYWTDSSKDRPRVIFITEYMSSGSLRQFLKKTKRSNRTLKAWKRWCTQILSALSYLHSCSPPIIHGNLTTDTIFIQHNGLIKIGSVAPDAIYNHVKTFKEEPKHLHYSAPEYKDNANVTTSVDIYSFGICALEMAALDMSGNGETTHSMTDDAIVKAIESIEDVQQKDFISKCLEQDPNRRPTARDLLFHPILFEVHSLKLLTAHVCIKSSKGSSDDISSLITFEASKIVAEIPARNNKPSVPLSFPQSAMMDLEKFIEDVRNGVYPLTAFGFTPRPASTTPKETTEIFSETDNGTEPDETVPPGSETRLVIRQSCQIAQRDDKSALQLTLLLRMDDQMNRQLQCEFTKDETPNSLAEELVQHGFINSIDCPKIAILIEEKLRLWLDSQQALNK
ncbi:hypothetical protein HELRODRAFT_185521 [Helobdella robusta]|uniref:Nuclear receptor-binding protein homolog n=1 Tax=Helobdella robusta TaxID=6412 RepID=T1FMX5_HELRO|nr:hypothetical protein HELRODRAFT_185521 [Helobdella robusta]ESO04859.1 hypothetical protein HELRODRAFT_185521 [Helobdella robusta]